MFVRRIGTRNFSWLVHKFLFRVSNTYRFETILAAKEEQMLKHIHTPSTDMCLPALCGVG